jgi:hypothetical protein
MPDPNSPSGEFDPTEVEALLASLKGSGAEGDQPPVIDQNGQAVIDGKPTNAHMEGGKVVPGDGDRMPADVAAKVQPTQAPSELDHFLKVGDVDLKDIGTGVAEGVGKAAKATSQFAQDLTHNYAIPGLKKVLPGAFSEGLDQIDQGGAALAHDAFVKLPEAKEKEARLAASVTQFGVGLFGATKLTGLAGIGGVTINSAIAGGTVFDPHEERLSNLVEQHPSLANPITAYLAADPKDSAAEGRLKAALENGLVGGVADGLLNGLKAIKKVAIVRATEGDAAALKVAQEEVQSLTKKAQTVDEGRMALGKGEEGLYSPEGAQGTPEAKSSVSEAASVAGGASKADAVVAPDDVKDYLVDRIREELKNSVPISTNADNFNLAKMGGGTDVINIINRGGEAVAKDIDTLKGGVQSLKETKDLADILGQSPEETLEALARDAKGASEMAGRVVFAKRYMQGLAKQISEEARKLDQGVTGDDTPMRNLIDQLTTIQGHLKAVQTGAARATSAGRISTDPVIIRALVAADGDAAAVNALLNPKTLSARLLDAHNEFWINAILSGVKTQAVNALSNTVNTVARPLERMLGGVFTGDVGSIKDGFAHYAGMARYFSDAVKLASKSFLLEDSILAPAAHPIDAPRFALSNEALGVKAGFDWFGKAVRLPTRFLTASDEFFKQLNYRADLYARASRQGVEAGYNGTALTKFIDEQFAKGLSVAEGDYSNIATKKTVTTGRALDGDALAYAKKTTFTNELSGWTKDLQTFAGKHPMLRLVLPFIRTPTNIVAQTFDHTPLGMLRKGFWADVGAGGARRADAVGRMAFGGTLLGAATTMAINGNLSGRGPKDPNVRQRMMESGWAPYSVKVGNKWVSYQRIEPFGSLLGIVADMADAAGHMDDKQHTSIAADAMLAVANNLTSKTWMKGLSDTLDVLQGQDPHKAEQWIQQRTASYVGHPRQLVSLLTAGQTDDGYIRDVRSTLDAVMNQIPGLSDNLPPRRDFFGNPVHYPVGTGPDSISPIAISSGISDKAKEELARLGSQFNKPFGLPGPQVGNLDLTKYTKGNQSAYDRMLELRSSFKAGRYTLQDRLENLIGSNQYQKLPDGNSYYSSAKIREIEMVLGQYDHGIFHKLLAEYPDLKKDWETDKRNSKVVQSKGVGALKSFIVNQR